MTEKPRNPNFKMTDERYNQGRISKPGDFYDKEWTEENLRRLHDDFRHFRFSWFGWLLIANACFIVGTITAAEIKHGAILTPAYRFVKETFRSELSGYEKSLNKLLKRAPAATPEPLTVPEARDGNSNA